MRLPGLKTAGLAARWLRGRLVGGVPILGFHRVADTPADPYNLCVSRRHFAEQVEVLRRERRPIALASLVHALRTGEIPQRAVVVTFDDGYADNLYHALPELERHEVPATLFVATAYLGGEFWWDELARVVSTSPERLEKMARILERTLGARLPAGFEPTGSRRAVLEALSHPLRGLTVEQRRHVLARMRGSSARDNGSDAGDRALTKDEVVRLATGGLVDIGAHTVSHASLAELPAERQRTEIRDGKRALEEILGRSVTSFSYPNGSIGAATPDLVREAGFSCACGSSSDLASSSSDPYRLPRFWIGDWDGARFSRWLNRWVRT